MSCPIPIGHGARSVLMRALTERFRSVAVCAAAWSAAAGVCGAQVTTRVSTDAANAQVAGASRHPRASADGRFVAFSSTATTLVAGDTNGSADVFVKDRQTGAVTRVSVRTGGAEALGDSGTPDISADGRYVTFVSAAFLTADDANSFSCPGANLAGPSCPDVFVHDRTTGETTRVSVTTGGVDANGGSAAPRISGDGRFVVFESTASNLVPADTNQVVDVFLRDRQNATTTRLSVAPGGAQSDRPALSPTISDDGTRVIFLSDATTLDAAPDPLACDPAVVACTRVFVRPVPGGTTTRLPLTVTIADRSITLVDLGYRVTDAVIAGDGQSVTAIVHGILVDGASQSTFEGFATHWFAGGAPPVNAAPGIWSPGSVPPRLSHIAVSTTGRAVAYCADGPMTPPFVVGVFDRMTWVSDAAGYGPPVVPGGPQTGLPDCESVSLSADGLTAFFASSGASLLAGDTNAALDVFAFDLDTDHDGMSSGWESAFGLNAADPADAALDPDADGSTNQQEFAAGTHPRGLFKYYLAEGAANGFFSTAIDVFKPDPSPAPPAPDSAIISGQFLGQNGRRTVTPMLRLYDRASGASTFQFPPRLWPEAFQLPDQAFSTLVESDKPLAVERTLTWGGGMGAGYGSHAERAVSGPALTWHFAEGATHGAFDLFYLLQNPGSTPATATITYLLPAPRAPIVRAYALLPNSRRTIYVDQEPGLEATDVSARIDATQPIFAERAMYMSTPGQTFAGGTASAGITAPAVQWFIAEGATGAFFDLFILIGNPSASSAAVTVTYLLPNGTTVEKTHQVAAQSRTTIAVKGEDARLAATAVSATITSTNAVPIVVERAMWWPSPNWYEGTVTAGTTTSAARWALAGGFVDQQPETETYLLIANPGAVAANVTIDVGASGQIADPLVPSRLACRVTVPVPARGRYTTGLKGLCPALQTDNLPGAMHVAGTIESDGPPIVVERSTYWSAGGQFWAAGASTLLTPLP
jgi:hypothetical protein